MIYNCPGIDQSSIRKMESKQNQSFTIDQLSEISGISKRNIRFYVSKKLVPPPVGETRASRYDASHLEALERIKAYQAKGQSLAFIQSVFEKARQRDKLTKEKASEDCYYELPVAKGIFIKFHAHDCPLNQNERISLAKKINQLIEKQNQEVQPNDK